MRVFTEVSARDLVVGDVFASGGTVTKVDTTSTWGQVVAEVDYTVQVKYHHGDSIRISRDAEELALSTSTVFTVSITCDNSAFEPEVDGATEMEVARILEHVANRMREGHQGDMVLLDAYGNDVGRASFDQREISSWTPARRQS